MEFDRSDRPVSNVFPELGKGVAVGMAANTVALGLCAVLALGVTPLLMGLAPPGWPQDLAFVPMLVGSYWAMGFSVVQVAYLGPLAFVFLVRGRRPLALGLVIAMAVTFLLQTMCVGVGGAYFMWALSQPGALH